MERDRIRGVMGVVPFMSPLSPPLHSKQTFPLSLLQWEINSHLEPRRKSSRKGTFLGFISLPFTKVQERKSPMRCIRVFGEAGGSK